MDDDRVGGIRSVEKAVAILRSFGHDQPELGVTELSRRLALHKSTVSRLLSTLERGGLVERNPDNGRYRLGVELIGLAGQVVRHADLRTVARPYLEELAMRCEETVNLVVWHEGAAMNIEQFVPANRQIRDIGWVGRRTPLHATSTGKVLLAYRTPAERDAIIATLPLPQFTEQTITDRSVLCEELRSIEARGFALGMEELEVGLRSVAAPVCDHSGAVVATVSISGPAYRVTSERMPELIEWVLEAAGAVSQALGWASGS